MVSEIHSHLPESFKMGDESRGTGLQVDETSDWVWITLTRVERLESI